MKAIVIFVLLLFVGFLTTAQDMSKTKMLESVEVKPPVFTGVSGTMEILKAENSGSIYDYLSENVQYPENMERKRKEGTTVIQFAVFANGKLGNFKVVNSISEDLDQEVINVLKSTDGMWKPGLNNDIPVEMEKEVSVTFVIDGSDHQKIAKRYYKRATKKLMKNKPKKALRIVNYALAYQPYEDALLYLRARTHLELGNSDNACDDFNRLKSLGYNYADEYLKTFCEKSDFALLGMD